MFHGTFSCCKLQLLGCAVSPAEEERTAANFRGDERIPDDPADQL
jgi:hypothetical protein